MVTEIIVDEVTEFRSAVSGVEIDWVRTDLGFGPAFMTSSGDDRVAVSNGGVDFSTILNTEIPEDRVGLQLATRAPDGMRWCGSEGHDMDARVYQPGTAVMGNVPAGSRASTVIAWLDPLNEVADALGVGDLGPPTRSDPLPATPEVRSLIADLLVIGEQPSLLETSAGTTRLLEATARAIASVGGTASLSPGRGFDSRGIVSACLEYVEASGDNQPSISQLCRTAYASESRLRQAFVEVLGVPPIQYFQVRVLSILRNELLAANPVESTVTREATSLGLTQLGRVAGRYRSMFGETPRETLHRREARRY